MEEFGPFAVAIAFWVCIGACAIAGIVADYKKRQAAIEPVRAALERGQPIDPAVVERLVAPEVRPASSPVPLRVGGIITVSAGVGVIVLAFLLAQVTPAAFYPVLGGGVVALCVGAGLIVAARTVEAHARTQGTRGS